MSHFGVVAPAFYSHFQAFQALASELIDRGHQVTFFQQGDACRWLTDQRIDFHSLGFDTHPSGSLNAVLRRAASSNNPLRLRPVIRDLCRTTTMLCAELPAALALRGVDVLLCDQMEAAGGLIAEGIGLPYVSLACALPVNRDPHLPLPVMPFAFGTDERSQRIYRGSQRVYDWLMSPLGDVLKGACRRLALPPRGGLHEFLSPYAQISQTVEGFDFPRTYLPGHFHAVGPLRSPAEAKQGDLPIEPGRPFVFASLGTLQGKRMGIFERISAACRRLDAQLLVAHCGGLDRSQERELKRKGATWVTDFAPQQWVLGKADALVSHGGMNTVMDAIVARTPMLVMPIGFDQPGVASRVSFHKLGLRLHRRAGARKIHERLQRVLDFSPEPLNRLAVQLEKAGGRARAANIIETVARTKAPVLRELVS
ncbi:zeaxanthin glucosyltransferase [Pseudomonas sp. S25]|uniref:Zeaxanthin glucosyltransferase n=1 Tax=Pseudomonas maioricensis TaxID=1766623 RepID=A0ABS9ZR93_9PSED|nr:glycosyltransferase [Pseudomonas sp. S25]MCI8211388.1 zeaxanthin glucosyltransferase [Pseudomonas sp. S25]